MKLLPLAGCVLGLLQFSSPSIGQPVRTHTLWEWDAGSEFVLLSTISEPPFQGEIVETRINLTLHDVPEEHHDVTGAVPLDASDILIKMSVLGAEPAFPDFFFERPLIVQGGFHLELSGTGGPKVATFISHDLNGLVYVPPAPGDHFWEFETTNIHADGDGNFVSYGPASGSVEIDYIPAADPCPCERTGDAPPSVNVFDLLAYLDQWFAQEVDADVNGDANVDVFDLLEFLDCWFSPDTACS